jgi:alanine-glyoxylate transaminase/serine-glyoxylate transaminase/serine-pyruvate transaminase
MRETHGRPYLAIPGPSVMPDRVLAAMHRASPDIYSVEIRQMVGTIIEDLKKVARTKHDASIYICNGHGAWEAAIANCFSAGDNVVVLSTGRFGFGWAETGNRLGIDADILDFGLQTGIDLDKVADHLRSEKGKKAKAVLVAQTDTSSSVLTDIHPIRALLDDLDHPALLMVDCIASLATDRFEMDSWGVDVMVSASQKGLMTPPGMGFVWASPKARAARDAMVDTSPYWDWNPRFDPQDFYQYFCGTAPTHHLFGLREALDMLVVEQGMDATWARHEKIAHAVWAAFDVWSTKGAVRLNVADPARRSNAVTAASIDNGGAERLRSWVSDNAGLTLGVGLGMTEPDDPRSADFFRLAHMGHVNANMALGALATMDAGLKALNIPHGSGAIDAASKAFADG